MIEAIEKRRSIRRFIKKPIAKKDIMEIIEAGTLAPSEKHAQPWKFIVISGSGKKELARRMKAGIERNRNDLHATFGKSYEALIPSAIYTMRILQQADTIIFVMNTKGKPYNEPLTMAEHLLELTDVQSVSAAIENMCLEATQRGIGSLWTCNIYLAYEEIKEWLQTDGEAVAAIAFGYTDREARKPARKPLEEVIDWTRYEEAEETSK